MGESCVGEIRLGIEGKETGFNNCNTAATKMRCRSPPRASSTERDTWCYGSVAVTQMPQTMLQWAFGMKKDISGDCADC